MIIPKVRRISRQAPALLLLPAVLVAPVYVARAQADADSPTDPTDAAEPEPPFDGPNWVTFGIGGTIVNGDAARFQQRYGLPEGVFGGVESFHYQQDLPKDGLLKIDGRGIFNNEDYGIRLELNYPDRGFVRAGYREFRSYYDGSGGYDPTTGTWINLYDDDLYIDRSEFVFEAGLRLPERPEVTLRYVHSTREGTKDSTSWGSTLVAPPNDIRAIVPSFYDLDEVTDSFMLDARHVIKETTVGLGLRYDLESVDNTRNERDYPGQPRDRYVTQRDEVETDFFNLHAFVESWLGEKWLLTTGYAFTDLDSDLSGYRVFGTSYDPDLADRLPNPSTFQDLSGGSQLHQHVLNLNLLYLPWESVAVVPAVRVEKQDIDSQANYLSPAQPLASSTYGITSDRGLLDVSESLELRYTGLTNWSFNVRGYWLQGSGDLDEDWNNLTDGWNVVDRETDDDRTAQKYSVGANWYPTRRFNLGVGYYYKNRQNDYDHRVDNTSNAPGSFDRYPAFLTAHEYTTQDANVRATWRPRHNVTLVARYDYQWSTVDTRADFLAEEESADITTHMLGLGANWIPFNRLYLQGNLNYVFDETETPAGDLNQVVGNFSSDYWIANAALGCVIDDKTDFEASYYYYRADNYDTDGVGQPYGSDAQDNGVLATLSRQISRQVRLSLRYGFFTHRDGLYGGHNDYDAHLISTSLQYRF